MIGAVFDLEPRPPIDSDYESRAPSRQFDEKRGLVVVFTDLLDEAAARR